MKDEFAKLVENNFARQEGYAEGREVGREEGCEVGREEGREEGFILMAEQLRRRGMAEEEIVSMVNKAKKA